MTRAHAADATRIHLEAFAGYMNSRLGPGYVRAFLGWFADAAEAVALVALDDDTTVGYVVGAPLGYGRSLNRHLLVPAALGAARRPWLALDARLRRTALGRVAALLGRPEPTAPPPSLPEPTWSLVGVGMAPGARGRGHGEALVRAFEEQAARRGARALRLSVYPENQAARRLYQRCGWIAFDGPRPEGFAMYYSKVLA